MNCSIAVMFLELSLIITLIPFVITGTYDTKLLNILFKGGYCSWRISFLTVPGNNGLISDTETNVDSFLPYNLCELI
jgi:hypothetical protein